MQRIFTDLTREQADTYGLVLLSSGIKHRTEEERGGWSLWVGEGSVSVAIDILKRYQIENKGFQTPAKPSRFGYRRTWAGIWGALVILSCHIAVTWGNDAGTFHKAYGASARHIVNGEWYRAAAALLLHVDYLHLIGNMAGMALFATAVCSVTGWGMGWALILTTGIVGNLANAYFYEAGHNAIGASTALFGALGLLSSYQFLKNIRQAGARLHAFLPFGAGLALLAFLGSSSHTDIMAHLFGFLAGILIGLGFYGYTKQSLQWTYQLGALMATAIVIVLSWFWPMMK